MTRPARSATRYTTSGTLSTLIDAVRSDRRKQHLLVSTIDPYGDTRFSSTQAIRLLRELDELRRQSSPADRIVLGHFLSVIRAVEGSPDEWLEFVGD